MQFTLDSVEHAKQALLSKFKQYKIITQDAVLLELSELIQPRVNVFYFGVLTLSDDFDNCDVMFSVGFQKTLINVSPNAQIIELFTELYFLKDGLEVTEDLQGQFRGFRLTLEG